MPVALTDQGQHLAGGAQDVAGWDVEAAATAFVVEQAGERRVDGTMAGRARAQAEFNVTVADLVDLIEAAKFVEELGGNHHAGASHGVVGAVPFRRSEDAVRVFGRVFEDVAAVARQAHNDACMLDQAVGAQ